MLARWGILVARRRTPVLVLGLVFVLFAGIWGTGAFSRLNGSSDLNDPSSESQVLNARVTQLFGRQTVDLVALYSSADRSVTDPSFEQSVEAVTARVRTMPGVTAVLSYYGTGAPALVSADRHATYIGVRFAAGTKDKAVRAVRRDLAATGLTTQVGGQKAVDEDINDRVGPDIARAEMIAMPVLLLALLVIFGTAVAAAMPLLIGGVAILGAFTIVRAITYVTDISSLVINIITILGLGLAVDYGLFVVSRFREELSSGRPVPHALARTLSTAGRTVLVSGVVVTLSLSSLLLFPQTLLRSMGLGGAAAVLVAMVTSLTVLPAMLALVGRRIDAGRMPWARRRIPSLTGALAHGVHRAERPGWWGRVAHAVMRRPVLFALGSLVVLGVLAAPFAQVHFGGIDERMLPPGTESRVVSERLAADFDGAGIRPISVLVTGSPEASAQAFAGQVADVPGVRTATVTATAGEASLISATFTGDASSPAARTIVERIRALAPPAGAQVMVGGTTASVVDQLHSLGARLPWMALVVAGVTFVLMALAFGSLVVPLKAVVMNMVSIAAAFGVVVWIFQEGHLSDLLGFTATGYVEASQPILMVAILFGLSMDYEVFLLSRVRERYDAVGDNTAAVAEGVQRTGGIITAAAVLLCIVVGAFSTSGLTFIKMVGIGMLVALLVDATLVRLVLVPATMRLLGRGNWWAPGFLRRLHARSGLRESDPASPDAGPLPVPAQAPAPAVERGLPEATPA